MSNQDEIESMEDIYQAHVKKLDFPPLDKFFCPLKPYEKQLFDILFSETPIDRPLHVELSDCLPVAGIDFKGAGYDW